MIRECSEEVRLGMIRLLSAWSRVPGRPSRSPVRGRTKEVCVLSEGAIASVAAGSQERPREDQVLRCASPGRYIRGVGGRIDRPNRNVIREAEKT